VNVQALGESRVLLQGRVECDAVGPKQTISRQVAQFADGRRRETARVHVADSVGARIIRVNGRIVATRRAGDIVRAVVANRPDVGGAVTKRRDIERAAGGEVQNSANLPA